MYKHKLYIDLETYSGVDIKKTGAQRYIDDPEFEILLIGFAIDDNPVPAGVIEMHGEKIPDGVCQRLVDALRDPRYIKIAHNAAFEFGCLSKYYGELDPSQWRCSMFHSMYAGYPATLEAAGKALGMPEDKQKLTTGKALIRYFCNPCAPTKANGGRTRNRPEDAPEKWQQFIEYNRQDVVAEREIERRLSNVIIPDWLQRQWETDLRINRRGVAVDAELVSGALDIWAEVRRDLTGEAVRISGLENPNSVSQLLNWISKEIPEDKPTDLRKETVTALLTQGGHTDEMTRMLEIRQELGKTSTKKYDAIVSCVCPDGRVHGLLQFYGANRTGRWAGRLVQVQNLPRTYTNPIDPARDLIKNRQTKALQMLYGSVPDTLSQLIRTAFVPAPGKAFVDADFSAIEARVIAWLSGETWVLDAFRAGKDIYCETASQMFGVPVVKGGVNGHLRQRGKVVTLACGYQGGVGAMRRMDTGHLLDSSSDAEVKGLVDQWRNANRHTVQFWWDCESAAKEVIQSGGACIVRINPANVGSPQCLTFALEADERRGSSALTVRLPSGRKLYYLSPRLAEQEEGRESITYVGVDQTTRQWTRLETYGGKLVENITQAVARDCLAVAIERLEKAGVPVVFHIHDEVVCEVDDLYPGQADAWLDMVLNIMGQPIDWAPGLPLSGDGWAGKYFKKD